MTSFALKTNNSYMRRNKQPTVKEWAEEIQQVLFLDINGLYFGQHSLSIVLMPNASIWLMKNVKSHQKKKNEIKL